MSQQRPHACRCPLLGACLIPYPERGQSPLSSRDTYISSGVWLWPGNTMAPSQSSPGWSLCPRERQEHVCIPLFSDSDSWNLHPLGFAIFTHPEPSGLHGDASKQQIPGGNDVTFPFPAAQASRRCCLGPRGCPVLCPLGAALSQDSRSAGYS